MSLVQVDSSCPLTDRLYFRDSQVKTFINKVVACTPEGDNTSRLNVYLEGTHFVPTAGGQPNDLGVFKVGGSEYKVVDVVEEPIKEEGQGGVALHCRIRHVVELKETEDRDTVLTSVFAVGSEVEGSIDWLRRTDHRQQHSGQHLLTAVLENQYGLVTCGFHLGTETCTIDLTISPKYNWDDELMKEVELKVNDIVMEDRPVSISFKDISESAVKTDPPTTGSDSEEQADLVHNRFGLKGEVRIVSISGMDSTACCGTHVSSTGEIGAVMLRKCKKEKREWNRLEFVCGRRSVLTAREDWDILQKTAAVFNRSHLDVPGCAEAVSKDNKKSGKELSFWVKEWATLLSTQITTSNSPTVAKVLTSVKTAEEKKETTSSSPADDIFLFKYSLPTCPSEAAAVLSRCVTTSMENKTVVFMLLAEGDMSVYATSNSKTGLNCLEELEKQVSLPEGTKLESVAGGPNIAKLKFVSAGKKKNGSPMNFIWNTFENASCLDQRPCDYSDSLSIESGHYV